MMEEKVLTKEIVSANKKANQIAVIDAESYKLASGAVLSLDEMIKKIKMYWKGPKEKAHQTWKEICAKENEMLAPVEFHRKELNTKIRVFLTEQERIKREEQARIDAERRKQEEAERAKLVKAADKAEKKGDEEKAGALREQAESVYVPPVIVQGEVDKTTRMDGGTVSTKKDIGIDIVDIKLVLSHVINGRLPIDVITLSEAKIKAHIKSWGLKELDGVIIRETINTQFRRAK